MKTKHNKGEIGILYIFLLLLLILVLVLSIYASYIIYRDFLKEPENLNVSITPNINNQSEPLIPIKQFNNNMKFNHNNLSYRFFECSDEKKSNIRKTFEIISNDTQIIAFFELPTTSSDEPDIEILCSETYKQIENLDSEYFIAGEGGPKEIIQTGKFNVITKSSILLYSSNEKDIKCNLPIVEIHELMHVFGFDHSTEENSLMYPYLTSCSQKLDSSIINELKRIYSIENLPDLYFENFSSPLKKGRYLNLNFTIKNSGTINAKNVNFTIIEDGKELETHELGDINFGAGIIMKMENIKLTTSSPEKLSIIIDYKREISELDRNNNIAEIVF